MSSSTMTPTKGQPASSPAHGCSSSAAAAAASEGEASASNAAPTSPRLYRRGSYQQPRAARQISSLCNGRKGGSFRAPPRRKNKLEPEFDVHENDQFLPVPPVNIQLALAVSDAEDEDDEDNDRDDVEGDIQEDVVESNNNNSVNGKDKAGGGVVPQGHAAEAAVSGSTKRKKRHHQQQKLKLKSEEGGHLSLIHI